MGFFLKIGIGGLPDADALWFAFAMALLLPLRRCCSSGCSSPSVCARALHLSAASLTNYSEFGLIVASVVLPQWLMPLAITVALSFIISAQISRVAHRYTSGWRRD